MCGIGGVLCPVGESPATGLLEAIAQRLAHRGPDDQQVFVDGAMGLAHTRLSIIDISGGRQPIGNEDQTVWITFNGEIYNFVELRHELLARGHVFKTNSDTEVIVHLYEDVGERCVEHLNGIFAFALWDARRQRLLLARDPFGVKPLYYADTDRKLVFASELKALLADPSLSTAIDATALSWFLTYGYVPSPRTLLAAVKKLPPGHLLIAERGQRRLTRFAMPRPQEQMRISESDAVDLIRREFSASVTRQMMSDVPIGAFLSGGVDSGAVVAVMSEQSHRVRTYSIGFEEGGDADELAEARATAQLFGTDHSEIVISRGEYVDALPEVVWQLDEPLSTSSALPLYFLARLAKRDVKVALTGQGADEPLAGYTRYLGERYRGPWAALPTQPRRVARRLLTTLPRLEAMKRGLRSLDIDDEAERFHQIHALLPDDVIARLLRPEIAQACVEDPVVPMEMWLDGLGRRGSSLARLQYVDMRTSLADNLLLYGDRMTMAHGVEMRVPFLDLPFVDLLERLPTHLKVRGLQGKYIWKKAVQRWLPTAIVRRRKKGFATPVDAWLRGRLGGYARDTLLDPSAALARFIDQGVLSGIVSDHQRGRHNYHRSLFALLSFELWHEQLVKRDTVATPAAAPAPAGRVARE
jgi:asparagine synthase (glutamine-hydrolysing)